MGRLDGSINEQVQLSITFDGASQFYLHFKGVTNCAADGIRSVEGHRVVNAAAEGIHPSAFKAVIQVHRMRSRDHFRTSHVTFTVWSGLL